MIIVISMCLCVVCLVSFIVGFLPNRSIRSSTHFNLSDLIFKLLSQVVSQVIKTFVVVASPLSILNLSKVRF
jgi:hypothetical protein